MSFNGLTELQAEVITARVQAIRSQKAALAAAKQQAHQTAKFASVMALLLFEGVLCLGYLMYRALACDPTLLDWQCSRKTFQDHYEHITQLLTIGGVLFATGPTVFAPILSAPALALLENFHNHASRTALPPTLEGLKFKHAPSRAGVEMTTTAGNGASGGRRARTSSTAVSGNLLLAAAPVTLPAPSRSGGFALGSINGSGGAAAPGRGRLPPGVSLDDIDTPADTFVDVRDEVVEDEGAGSDADETGSSGERAGPAADGRVWCRRGHAHAAAMEGRGEARTGGWCAPSSAEGPDAVFCRGRGRAGSSDAAAAGSLLRLRAPANKLAASGISEPSAAGAAYFSSSPLVLLLVSLVVYGSSVIGFGALGQVPWMFNSVNSADSWRFPAIILYLGGFLLIAAMVGYSIWLTSYSRSELLITCIIVLGIVFIYSSPFLMAAMLGVPSDTIVFHPHHYLMAAHVALLLRAPDPLVTVMRFVLFGVFTQGIAAYSPASMLSN